MSLTNAAQPEEETMLTVISCPDCGAPAEITEHFCLPSTDGPVAHVGVRCAAGHHFRMAADRLTARPPKRPRARARGVRNMLRAGILPPTVHLPKLPQAAAETLSGVGPQPRSSARVSLRVLQTSHVPRRNGPLAW
jgi:hypothetical protein